MKRIAIIVGIIALVFGSLIAFPADLPVMVAIWLVPALIAAVYKKPMWPWLVSPVLILAIKRPGFPWEFWVIAILFLMVALLDWRAIRKNPERLEWKRLLLGTLVLIAATITYGVARWTASNTSHPLTLDDRPIACLGDSLTDYGYPQELEKRISVPVADFGVSGIKTDAGIKMIPDILAANPQLVVIELGGHDYNADNKPRSATQSNLEKLIEAFLARDIGVVLVEIPLGFISDPYDGLYRQLAAKYDLQLVDDSVIRSFVFNSPILPPGMWLDSSRRYSNDGLHPNALGKQHFARVITRSLVKIYGDSILK